MGEVRWTGLLVCLLWLRAPPPASSREPSESAADCLEPSARVTSAASSACAARAVQSMLRPDESTELEFGMAQTTSDAHLNTPGQLNATFKKTLCRGCFCTPGPALPGKSRCRHREGLPRDNASAQVVWAALSRMHREQVLLLLFRACQCQCTQAEALAVRYLARSSPDSIIGALPMLD